jgi:hypothetical protein
MFSLNEALIKTLIKDTLPSFQNVENDTLNLGFGYIYYSFVRTLRPKNIVVIGSKAGFTPVMFGLGVKDNEGFGVGKIECYNTKSIVTNEFGKVFFIDPSYSVERNDNNHWYGIGFWDNPQEVKNLWAKFEISEIVEHYKMTSEEFVNSKFCPNEIDLIYIDGDHSYNGIMNDFKIYFDKIKRNGMIIAHDVDPQVPILLPDAGGYEAFNDLSEEKFEKLRLPIFPGLAIIRKK